MRGFDGPLLLKDLGEHPTLKVQVFETLEDCVFKYGINAGGMLKVRVPAGTKTDFASVPRWLWWFFPPMGRWNRAALVHDYLCNLKGCSRFLADAIFREAMAVLEVPVWRRVSMYYAVRIYAVLSKKR